MPWNGTTLWLGHFAADGTLAGNPERITGGPAESIFQPEWSPDGAAIVFVSDRSDWWNPYRFEIATAKTTPLAPRAAEFGQPQWVFGMSTYAFAGPDRMVCAYYARGLGTLAVLDLEPRTLQPLDLPQLPRRPGSAQRPAPHREAGHEPPRQSRAPHRRLPDQGRADRILHHRRHHGVRPVLSAAQSRL